jgi:hypothetical protein
VERGALVLLLRSIPAHLGAALGVHDDNLSPSTLDGKERFVRAERRVGRVGEKMPRTETSASPDIGERNVSPKRGDKPLPGRDTKGITGRQSKRASCQVRFQDSRRPIFPATSKLTSVTDRSWPTAAVAQGAMLLAFGCV